MHLIYKYFRESRTSSGYTIKYGSNRKSTNPDPDLPQMQNGEKKIVTTAIKMFGSAPILEGWSTNSKQTYFYFLPVTRNMFTMCRKIIYPSVCEAMFVKKS